MSNKIFIQGRLTADAVRGYTAGANPVAVLNFDLADNIKRQKKEHVNFYHCQLFGRRAESSLINYLVKGKEIVAQGELIARAYATKEGRPRLDLLVNLSDIWLCSKSEEITASGGGAGISGAGISGAGASSSSTEFNDDIPF